MFEIGLACKRAALEACAEIHAGQGTRSMLDGQCPVYTHWEGAPAYTTPLAVSHLRMLDFCAEWVSNCVLQPMFS
jgi:hypothetical protein